MSTTLTVKFDNGRYDFQIKSEEGEVLAEHNFSKVENTDKVIRMFGYFLSEEHVKRVSELVDKQTITLPVTKL